MATDQALVNLEQIKYIVVVMMENRSFDHMLGHFETRRLTRHRGPEP